MDKKENISRSSILRSYYQMKKAMLQGSLAETKATSNGIAIMVDQKFAKGKEYTKKSSK